MSWLPDASFATKSLDSARDKLAKFSPLRHD
jgi:hypothetical protein